MTIDADLIHAAITAPDGAAEVEGRRNRDVLHDYDLPAMVRGFIAINQGPATETMAIRAAGMMPRLYGTWTPPEDSEYAANGPIRVRVVMVSRLGDIGISSVDKEYGYFTRCSIYDLTDFSDEMDPTAPATKPFVKNFAVATKEGFWVQPYQALPNCPDFIVTSAPYLYPEEAQARRFVRKVDEFGLKGLKVVPLLLTKVQE